jgi:hypothetical protein
MIDCRTSNHAKWTIAALCLFGTACAAADGRDGYLVEKGLTPLPKAWLDLERSTLDRLDAHRR